MLLLIIRLLRNNENLCNLLSSLIFISFEYIRKFDKNHFNLYSTIIPSDQIPSISNLFLIVSFP